MLRAKLQIRGKWPKNATAVTMEDQGLARVLGTKNQIWRFLFKSHFPYQIDSQPRTEREL